MRRAADLLQPGRQLVVRLRRRARARGPHDDLPVGPRRLQLAPHPARAAVRRPARSGTRSRRTRRRSSSTSARRSGAGWRRSTAGCRARHGGRRPPARVRARAAMRAEARPSSTSTISRSSMSSDARSSAWRRARSSSVLRPSAIDQIAASSCAAVNRPTSFVVVRAGPIPRPSRHQVGSCTKGYPPHANGREPLSVGSFRRESAQPGGPGRRFPAPAHQPEPGDAAVAAVVDDVTL